MYFHYNPPTPHPDSSRWYLSEEGGDDELLHCVFWLHSWKRTAVPLKSWVRVDVSQAGIVSDRMDALVLLRIPGIPVGWRLCGRGQTLLLRAASCAADHQRLTSAFPLLILLLA